MSQRMIDQDELHKGRSFVSGSSDRSERNLYKQLTSLIAEDQHRFMPYRSKFELQYHIYLSTDTQSPSSVSFNHRCATSQSVSSNKSRKSRDSDLLRKLAKQKSKSSFKHNSSMHLQSSGDALSKSHSGMSEEQQLSGSSSVKKKQILHIISPPPPQQIINIHSLQQVPPPPSPVARQNPLLGQSNPVSMVIPTATTVIKKEAPPKIHNCVCFVLEQCLSYNCNCFLSPLPCTPECCPNCIILKSSLPLKITNACNCKKTRCLKLYCECLAKGLYCSIMCRCELCQNHQTSIVRKQLDSNQRDILGCNCKKTFCDKKYCQCYAQGKNCNYLCGCITCYNNKQSQPPLAHHTEDDKNNLENSPQIRQLKMDIEDMQFEEPDFSFQPKAKPAGRKR